MQTPLSNAQPSVAILVLNWNGEHLLPACLTPLTQQTYRNYELLLIDNGSTDRSVAYVQQTFPQVEIVENGENLGFAKGNNVGLRLVLEREIEYAILVNNDVIVSQEWLSTFVTQFVAVDNLGVAGCKLLFPNGSIQHLGGYIELPQVISHHPHQFEPDIGQMTTPQDADYVTGAAFVIGRKTLAEVGLLDALFSPAYFEEVDYCYRVRAHGLRVVLLPTVAAIHNESSTTNRIGNRPNFYYLNRLRFAARHVPIAQFQSGFIAAEILRLATRPASEIVLIRELCLQVALELPRTLATDRPLDDLRTLQTGLLALRDALAQPAHTLTEPNYPLDWSFPATAPIVGKAVAWLRTQWFNVAAKWPLRAAIQQQAQFNRDVIASQAALQEQQQQLIRELDQVSAELARLQQTVRNQQQHTDR